MSKLQAALNDVNVKCLQGSRLNRVGGRGGVGVVQVGLAVKTLIHEPFQSTG